MSRWFSGNHERYDEQCPRCATVLPSHATICRICGYTLTIPVQLPAPREAVVKPAA
ncbi:MAG TPA: hypothetical protein VHE57_09530 [Mycobacteriales bacterium]|nr:hypothetical protein [Mycobacteriales bacterium]